MLEQIPERLCHPRLPCCHQYVFLKAVDPLSLDEKRVLQYHSELLRRDDFDINFDMSKSFA